MNESRTTWLERPVRLVPRGHRDSEGSAGFAVTSAAYREFVRSARLRPYIGGELRRWRAGRDLIAVGAAIRTAFADAEWPVGMADAIAAGYARLGGDGTVVTVRSLGSGGVFRHVSTTDDVLAACKRCFAAPFTDEAIADREGRRVSQFNVAVSIGIERESRPVEVTSTEFAPTAAECAGYVIDSAEIRQLASLGSRPRPQLQPTRPLRAEGPLRPVPRSLSVRAGGRCAGNDDLRSEMTTSVTAPAGGASGPGQGPVAAGSASHPAVPVAGWDALAADGSVVRIRPIAADDEPALTAMNQRLSDRSVYLRFFALDRRGADQHAHHLVDSSPGHRALVAECGGRLVGVASYEVLRPGEAEMAFLLDDAVHGRGIGTLLLEQLVAVARESGIDRLRADTLAENAAMLRVFTDSGFEQTHRFDSGVVELVLDTSYSSRTLDRMAERERQAEDKSLRPLFSPAAVAVIGAGRTPGGIGHEVLRALAAGGYRGELYAVNPRAGRIGDVAAYPSILAVPGPVDLAVIAVPAAQVREVLAECGHKGVAGAVILTSGFSELGANGLQDEILAIARRHSIRLIGPNCLGIVNTAPEVALNATFADVMAVPGSLAIAAQSGAVGIAVLDHASRIGLGISEFVSLGNKVDVSGNDLLLHWWNDPRTDVIALYLESFGNPVKFGRLARLVGRTKPVLVVKGGRSTGGRRAGASHTAAAATPDTAVDALFEQSGVLRMDTVEELVETARVLAGRPLPKGNRLAVIGNAGGAGVLAADAAGRLGLEVPELSTATQQELTEATGAVGAGNPVDLGAAASPETLERALRVVLDSGEADCVLVCYAATRAGSVSETYAAIAAAAADSEVPILVTCLGAPDADPRIPLIDGSYLPVFPFPESAVRALAHAVRYAAWRSRPQGVVPSLDRVDADGARTVVRRFLQHRPDGGWLGPEQAEQLLQCAGIPVVHSIRANDREQVLTAAGLAGYPVVLKTAAETIVHKTDVGGVRLGLADERAVEAAYDEIAAATGDRRVIVQAMAPASIEMVVGMVRDALFGPIVMAGSGGVLTDLMADRRWRGLPLTDLDASEMVRSLRCAPLLAGYRGAEPVDEAAVLDVLHRVAWLAETLPEIAELDINPLTAAPSGAVAVDAKLHIEPAGPVHDWYARHLR